MSRWSFRIGMPHMVPGKLSEVELLKMIGSYQWELISRALQQPSADIKNSLGERLYSSFISVELNLSDNDCLETMAEGEELFVAGRAGFYNQKFVEGLFRFGLQGDLLNDESPGPDTASTSSVYLTNAFVARKSGNTRLKVYSPVGSDSSDIPLLRNVPQGIADHTAAQGLPRLSSYFPEDSVIVHPMRGGLIPYSVLPESDLNGAGLLYFARYVAIMNYAERMLLTDRLVRPCSALFVQALSTRRRKLFFYANAAASDVVLVDTRARFVSKATASPSPFYRCPAEFEFEHSLYRKSDGELMARSTVCKQLLVPARYKNVLAEADRFIAEKRPE